MAGSSNPWDSDDWGETLGLEAHRRREKTFAMGNSKRLMLSTTCGEGSRHEPIGYLEHCKYQTGMRLWVRECFGFTAKWPLSYQRQWLAERSPWLPGNITMAYRADNPTGPWCWKPSIHMPKIYSRITLEITNVRVERLQEISPDDAIAEGALVALGPLSGHEFRGDPIRMYRELWNRVNAGRGYGWDTNPWVWVIEFVWTC